MKIFLSFFQSKQRQPIPAYDFWEYYIKNGIEEAGYNWDECPDIDWAQGFVPQSKESLARWRDEAWSKTIAHLKKHPADIFLSYLYPRQIDVNAIKQLKSMGIACVNFFCDNIREYTSIPKEFGVFDVNWVPEYGALTLYKKADFNFIHLPMPMWVEPKLRVVQDELYPQITFIGSKDAQRLALLNQIVNLNPVIPLTIYGNGWANDNEVTLPQNASIISKAKNQLSFVYKYGFAAYSRKLGEQGDAQTASDLLKQKTGKKLSFDEYTALTAQSLVTMGINRYPSFNFPFKSPNVYSRLRDIEAPMLGACYLTEWAPGIEQFYDTETEVNTYRSAAEFIQKAGMLINDKAKRTTLRTNAQKRALSAHSIPVSINAIKHFLNL
jgi:hypothetical protein